MDSVIEWVWLFIHVIAKYIGIYRHSKILLHLFRIYTAWGRIKFFEARSSSKRYSKLQFLPQKKHNEELFLNI